MTRIRVLLLAALIAAAPLSQAAAQDRGPRGGGQGQGQSQTDGGRRISLAEASRIVESSRSSGRFLGASDRGSVIVVRWDYGDGRIADIMVDARTGRIVGER